MSLEQRIQWEQQQQQWQQQQQQAGWPGQPDVLPSDFTVTPSVDLSRYAADLTFGGDESPTAAAAAARQQAQQEQQEEQQAQQGGQPPQAQQQAQQGSQPLQAPPRHGVAFAVPEGAGGGQAQPRGYDREPSWHKSRSLAVLQSIFEHPEPGEGEEEEEEEEGEVEGVHCPRRGASRRGT